MRHSRLCKCCLLGGLLWTLVVRHAAIAEPHMSPEVLEMLKNSKPASSNCAPKAEKKNPDLIKPMPLVDIKPELPCAILPTDVNHLRQSSNTVLVDTRTATEFAQFHIDGALNIKPAELRSKAFLRDKTLVLMGNGKTERELYIECKRLKSNGYKQVKVLWGGMPGWLTAGLEIVGQSQHLPELTRLTPSELWVESQFTSNLILVTGSHRILQNQIKGSVVISDVSPKTIRSAINSRIKTNKTGTLASVVLIASKNADIQAISQAIKPIPLLVYSESPGAFVSQLKTQSDVWQAHARGPKQPSGCGR